MKTDRMTAEVNTFLLTAVITKIGELKSNDFGHFLWLMGDHYDSVRNKTGSYKFILLNAKATAAYEMLRVGDEVFFEGRMQKDGKESEYVVEKFSPIREVGL